MKEYQSKNKDEKFCHIIKSIYYQTWIDFIKIKKRPNAMFYDDLNGMNEWKSNTEFFFDENHDHRMILKYFQPVTHIQQQKKNKVNMLWWVTTAKKKKKYLVEIKVAEKLNSNEKKIVISLV